VRPDQLTVYVKRILVVGAYHNRAVGGRYGYRDVLAERATPDRFASSGTANCFVCPNPLRIGEG